MAAELTWDDTEEIAIALNEKFPGRNLARGLALSSYLIPLVVSNGRLIEHGSFQSLLAQDGKLAMMWRNYQSTGVPTDEHDAGLSQIVASLTAHLA